MYFYSDESEVYTGHPVAYSRQNATKHYLTHYRNAKYLMFFAKNEESFTDRAQANKELKIAERKMAYWLKHPNFDVSAASSEALAIDKTWIK